jgi:hypothetical protein
LLEPEATPATPAGRGGEGDARVSESVSARGVSSRMERDKGRVWGVMACHWVDVLGDAVDMTATG